MEKALFTWIENHNQKHIPIDGITIKEKALRVYSKLKEMEPSTSSQLTHEEKNKFAASNGWLQGFLKRHAIHNVKIKGEVASADTAAAKEYPLKLAKIIEDGEYTTDQVFNADETGLFWKKMPKRTFIARSEKVASGFKVAKDRITFLFCCNASGDCILKPLLVNRSLRSRALKGVNLKNLPVHWMANKKAWVTMSVFNEWFNSCFVPEVKRYLEKKSLPFKALLLIDNAPGHNIVSDHPNIKIVFLPPNTTSLIQPLDQGIIATFKVYYVRRSFQYILNKMENDETLTVVDAWKQFSIMDCIKHSALALSEIRPSTLNGCWKTIWPKCVKNTDTTSSNRTEVYEEIISLAQTVGGEGFNNLSMNDIDEIIVYRPLNDEELLEIAQEQVDLKSSSDEDEPSPLGISSILEGLQLANKLRDHFMLYDPMIDRTIKFQSNLNNCMAQYKKLYNELSKKGAQRHITEFAYKINQTATKNVHENVSDVADGQLSLNANESAIQISDDESDIEAISHKRMRVLSENDSE